MYNDGSNQTSDIKNNDTGQTRDIFRVLVNAIVPRTPSLAYEYGVVQYFGALDAEVEEYIIFVLNSYNPPLAQSTAEMLDIVSIAAGYRYYNNYLYAVSYLINPQGDLSYLPVPYQDNVNLVASISSYLIEFIMMGFYSEWWGYGTTRLAEPNQRILEYYPFSWKQVGYPGPSLGYRAQISYNFT